MSPDRFRSTVLLIVLLYIALQIAYLQRLPLVMDEFDGAYEAYRLRYELPYRDFAPYKTVLGYYVQLPATFFASTIWGRLMALRIELLAINAAMLAAAAFYAARFLSRSAVVLALALFAASTPMLERAAEIRVDMLTGWAGLWSLLFLARRRYVLAGVLCAVSFAISQKAALYVVASNAVLVLDAMLERRTAVRAFLIFNAAAAAATGAYLAFWSLFADPAVVIRSTFFAASRVAVAADYDIQWRFWSQVLGRNPLLFVVAPAAIVLLLRRKTVPWHSWAIALYSAVLLLLCAIYKQPWPYFFVILFPTLFLLLAAFFDRLEGERFRLLLAACLLFGILYPLHRVFVVLRRDQGYQRYNVALAAALLDRGEPYLAANDILHDRQQAPSRLARLDAIRLRELGNEGAASHEQLVRQLEQNPPKLIIVTYRIYSLPPRLLAFIHAQYAPLSGSVYLYAPLVEAGARTVNLRFPGRYRVEVQSGQPAMIDGRIVESGTLLRLAAGPHRVTTPSSLRLRLLPEGVEKLLDSRYSAEQFFFPAVYD